MTSEGLGEMFEGDSADMCAGKFPLVSMGGQAEGLACADPGARTPIGASGIFLTFFVRKPLLSVSIMLNSACTFYLLPFNTANLNPAGCRNVSQQCLTKKRISGTILQNFPKFY